MSIRAAKTVERSREAAIRESEPRKLVAHRQFSRSPAPVCVVTPQDDMLAIATMVANRISSNRHATNCGSYVLANEAGKVFVLKEQSVTTPALVESNPRHLVGLYAANTKDLKRVRCPAPDRILIDLMQHFADLGGLVSA